MTGTLLCVLANPPLTDGHRTLARVDQLRTLLGYDDVLVMNLFPVATRDVVAISREGALQRPWLEVRPLLAEAVQECDGALLAYGVSEPTGDARTHHREQVQWLNDHLAASSKTTHTIGAAPHHPSRWQRWTSRAHPGVRFADALAASVTTTRAMGSSSASSSAREFAQSRHISGGE